jgi:nicotinamide-nucleotide amidase
MKAAIVTVGDEILIGQIVDTNSGVIAKNFDKIGIATHEMISISDDKNHILETLSKLQNNFDLVVFTGGLGPTKDDITKKTFCEYFDDKLIVNDAVLQHVTAIIETFFKRSITQLNKDQALVPSKCQVLFNQVGTAPGMWIENENTVFVSLPGVPFEMNHILKNELIPKLISKFKRPFIVHKTLMTYGVGESMLAEQIEDWENNLPKFIKLAYLPNPGRVRLRLTARGEDETFLKNEIDIQVDLLHKILGEVIVGFEEDETIEIQLGKLLTQKKYTIATAESCTGGKIASILSTNAGASNFFKGSIVCYNTDVKINVLGISKDLIQKHTVVSKQVAEEMALKAQKILKTDFVIATTGNAGPTKGDSDAELGTVFIAIATPNEVICEEYNFGQPRERVLSRAVSKALETIYKLISKNY